MKVIKRSLAIILWILATSAIISIIIGLFPANLLPLSIALVYLYCRWGIDLWCIDKDLSHINPLKKTLVYIIVYICHFIISAVVGIAISIYLGSGNTIITNWVFLITLMILSVLSPKRILLKYQTKDDCYIETPVPQKETSIVAKTEPVVKKETRKKFSKKWWLWVKKWDNTIYNKIFFITYGLYLIISLLILVDDRYSDATDYIITLLLVPYIVYFGIRIFIYVITKKVDKK